MSVGTVGGRFWQSQIEKMPGILHDASCKAAILRNQGWKQIPEKTGYFCALTASWAGHKGVPLPCGSTCDLTEVFNSENHVYVHEPLCAYRHNVYAYRSNYHVSKVF